MATQRSNILGIAFAVVLPLATAGAQTLSCAAPRKPMLEIDLLFGRNMGGRLGVSEVRWARFLAREVTPRFPDGLTVIDAAGQWRDARTKMVVREPAKLVRVVVVADAETDARIAAIVAAYKKEFRQDSVGIVMRPACASF